MRGGGGGRGREGLGGEREGTVGCWGVGTVEHGRVTFGAVLRKIVNFFDPIEIECTSTVKDDK